MCLRVCLGWGQGATASTSKKPAFSIFFSFGVQSFIIYTHEYIDNTADKGMCKSIHFHYIDSYYGRRDTDFLFVACPGRETCWSWSPTLLQLCSGQRPLRNLQTQTRQKAASLAQWWQRHRQTDRQRCWLNGHTSRLVSESRWELWYSKE